MVVVMIAYSKDWDFFYEFTQYQLDWVEGLLGQGRWYTSYYDKED